MNNQNTHYLTLTTLDKSSNVCFNLQMNFNISYIKKYIFSLRNIYYIRYILKGKTIGNVHEIIHEIKKIKKEQKYNKDEIIKLFIYKFEKLTKEYIKLYRIKKKLAIKYEKET